MNNSHLGMVRQWQELFYNKRYSATQMQNPDFVAIANAYHITGREVNKREELDEAIAEMLQDDKAFLLVVHVEEMGMVYPMTPAGSAVTNILY